MADYTLSAKATFDGSNFNKGIKSSESSLDGFKKKVSAISVAVGNILANGFGKAMSAVTSSIDSAVRRVDTMNNFPKVMKNLGYSAEDAEAAVSKMSDRLSGLPTTLDSMTSGVQRLVPSVKNVGTATDIMLALNDALLAGGSSIAVQEAAMEQFSQAVSKGKFELEEWRSVQTAMPGQLDQLAKSLMGSEAGAMDLYEAMKAGTIGMDQFLAELVRLDTEGGENFASFQQQALDGTSGIQTGMANAANAVTKGVASIFDAIGGERIAAGFNTIRQAITDTFNGISEQVGLFFSTMDSNEGFQLMQENFGLLQGIFSDIGSAIGIMVGELFGIQEGAEPAVAAADLLKGAMEGVRDVLTGVKDATAWLKENAQQLTPVLVGLVGAFIAFKVISGIAGFITAFSTALTGHRRCGSGRCRGNGCHGGRYRGPCRWRCPCWPCSDRRCGRYDCIRRGCGSGGSWSARRIRRYRAGGGAAPHHRIFRYICCCSDDCNCRRCYHHGGWPDSGCCRCDAFCRRADSGGCGCRCLCRGNRRRRNRRDRCRCGLHRFGPCCKRLGHRHHDCR